MESDEFYDSLEEEELEDDYVKNVQTKKEGPYTDSLEDELDDIIPFYDGNLSLSKINSSGQSSKCEFLASSSKLKIQTTKKEKTYLNLFYERNGEKCSRSNSSRVFQNYGDSRTDRYIPSPKSITTYGDTQIIDDDVDSMYLKSNISESEISCNWNLGKEDNNMVGKLVNLIE
ncbi:uncharacterized protein LOC130902564 isoform X2 [Diorhabda carinulata]|uniref:uncharacterized protein LOC130902564 isoform X2 n=1 Tax=Diorhabda carinulata TaxID=1163345 RepID=UPI0025A286A8|nr:uncharacterized protein LOC130902564 isoform X2 [Diorhabda carinulata]